MNRPLRNEFHSAVPQTSSLPKNVALHPVASTQPPKLSMNPASPNAADQHPSGDRSSLAPSEGARAGVRGGF